MFSADAAAHFLDEAHRARSRYENLPPDLAPASVADAYAAQAALVKLWQARLGTIAGLKIATTTKVMQQLMGIDHPCMGTIFASRVHRSPASIAKTDYVNVRIECELGLRLGRDLAGAPGSFTRENVRDAVAEVMPAFELIEDRAADYKSTKALSLIADNAWNGGIVLGQPKAVPPGFEFDGIAGVLKSNGKAVAEGRTDDPLGALAWLANQAAERGRPMTAGMAVITGSVLPTVDIGPGERLEFTLAGLGEVSLTAT